MKYILKLYEKREPMNNLQEYMAKDTEELKYRNTLQLSIWRKLTDMGFVEKKDMDMFKRFATYFNEYRDEHGEDLNIDIVLNDLSFLK
jgi:hypothetical protein